MSGQQDHPSLPSSAPDVSSLAALAKSVRLIKVWLIVLTLALGAFAAAVVVMQVVGDEGGEGPGYAADMYQPSEEQVAEARAEVEKAFGARLESVDARIVQVEMPEGAMVGTTEEPGPPPTLYVEYRLKGLDTPVAGTLMDPTASVASSGLVPTMGSLVSRMSDEEFEALLAAYAKVTPSALGGVRRYGDSPAQMPGQVVPDTVKSGGRTYRTDELWAVKVGALIEGDHVSIEESGFTESNVHVFHEDRRTGEFTYLGTEPGMWW